MTDIITQILLLPVKTEIDLDESETNILDLIDNLIEIQKLDLIDKTTDNYKIKNLYDIVKPELYKKFYLFNNINDIYGLQSTITTETTILFSPIIFTLDIFIIFNFIIKYINTNFVKTGINNKIKHKFKILYSYIKETK